MSITVTVENGFIKLPPDVHVPDGTRLEINLPEQAHLQSVNSLEQQTDREAWLAQSERRLNEIWDNDADDVYNELLSQ